MSEAKRCEVLLLDDRKLEMLVQPKLLVGELIDIAASHFNLREKEYFGIWYSDSINQKRWLRNEKKVLDHSFSKSAPMIELTFGVRLYVQSVTHLKDAVTIEMFFLQASKLICGDELDFDMKTAFLLAAYVMQATNGDYISESITRDDMRRSKVLPGSVTNELSQDECVEQVAFHYKRMIGLPRGDAIVNLLSIVERLPTYGVHFYDAKDKNEKNWKLGVSHRGIGQYTPQDTVIARKIYMWSRMENLYYRDKKFSIEVRDLTRTGSNQSMNSITKSFAVDAVNGDMLKEHVPISSYATLRARQPQPIVDTWYCPTTVDAREIWAISVGYHQLLVNNKDLQAVKTLKEIAKELTRSTSSLATSIDSEFTGSVCSSDAFWYEQEYADSGYSDLITALTTKKEMLKMRLKEREDELQEVLRQESELTAIYRERNSSTTDSSVGATFHFSEEVLNTSSSNEEMEKLTRDYEIQSQITAAAKRLSRDPKAKRRVRKERLRIYETALAKLRELESKMKNLKNSKVDVNIETNPRFLDGDETPNSLEEQQEDEDEIDYQTDYSVESFRVPDSELARRAMSLNPNDFRNGRFDNLRTNLRALRKEHADLSPSSRRMANSRYVIGDFDNSGIYSGLRNLRTNTIIDQYRNTKVSSSLTQIPRFNQHSSTVSLSGSFDELERHSLHQYKDYVPEQSYDNPNSIPQIIPNLQNGFYEETQPNFRLGRSSTSSYGSGIKSESFLSSAAWNQLSQPSMEHFMHNTASYYSDISSDGHYLSDELERLSNELIMEGDEEPEETLV